MNNRPLPLYHGIHVQFHPYIRWVIQCNLNHLILDRLLQFLRILTKYSIPKHLWVVNASICSPDENGRNCSIEWHGEKLFVSIYLDYIHIMKLRNIDGTMTYLPFEQGNVDERLVNMEDIVHDRVFQMHFL